ncbi:MAG: alpha/beta fold hydrolase [Cyanobacteriota bacterium]
MTTDNSGEHADWGVHREWHWRGHRCHWRHLGDAKHPALVLIHGFATGSGHWRRNAAALAAAGWSVYGLDLLGFGSSSQPSLRFDNRLWSRQLHGFLQEVVQEPAVLVGHSLGGLVALSCSVFFPRSVLALIAAPLPDPTLLTVSAGGLALARSRRPPWRRRLKRWLVVVLCRLLPLEVFVPLLARSPLLNLAIQTAYRTPVIGDAELHRLIARPARQAGAVRALRAMSMAMALRPLRATAPSLLRRLRHPMLVIWGEKDALVPLEVAWQCQRFQGELAISVIPGAGHCPHDEKAALFNEVLVSWLGQLSIPPTPSHGGGQGPRERVP